MKKTESFAESTNSFDYVPYKFVNSKKDSPLFRMLYIYRYSLGVDRSSWGQNLVLCHPKRLFDYKKK